MKLWGILMSGVAKARGRAESAVPALRRPYCACGGDLMPGPIEQQPHMPWCDRYREWEAKRRITVRDSAPGKLD